MINHGKVNSNIKPLELVVDDYSVWISSNITELKKYENDTVFEYNLIQYSKNEYIKILNEKNIELENQLIDTELALVELYESVGK